MIRRPCLRAELRMHFWIALDRLSGGRLGERAPNAALSYVVARIADSAKRDPNITPEQRELVRRLEEDSL